MVREGILNSCPAGIEWVVGATGAGRAMTSAPDYDKRRGSETARVEPLPDSIRHRRYPPRRQLRRAHAQFIPRSTWRASRPSTSRDRSGTWVLIDGCSHGSRSMTEFTLGM